MSSLVLQLSIISTFGLMVQSAPVDVTKRSIDTNMSKKEINQRKLENNIYCASQSLYITLGQLQNAAGFTLPSLSPVDINSNTKTIMNKILHHFSDQCKYFTRAMTLKHQLQEHLFTTDTAPELTSDNSKTNVVQAREYVRRMKSILS